MGCPIFAKLPTLLVLHILSEFAWPPNPSNKLNIIYVRSHLIDLLCKYTFRKISTFLKGSGQWCKGMIMTTNNVILSVLNMKFLIIKVLLNVICMTPFSGVDSGGARAPPEFEGSEKGRSLISTFQSFSYYSKLPWIWKAIYSFTLSTFKQPFHSVM